MRNRLIYILISVMVIALVGIIVIQTIWIKASIADRKKELSFQVNNALNHINQKIQEDESLMILEQRFGDVDSLMQTIVPSNNQKSSKIEIRIDRSKDKFRTENEQIIIVSDSTVGGVININQSSYSNDSTPISSEELSEIKADISGWTEDIQIRLDEIEESISMTVREENIDTSEVENISRIIEHYTWEILMGDSLQNRISPKELSFKIKTALTKQGIETPFEYAVYENDSIVKEFVSAQFQKEASENVFETKLFENDRKNKDRYDLIVQLPEASSFVWDGIRGFTILSIVFTLLIILAFVYALRLIFKQKKISQIKNDFINNMTHELKTPLASISLATSSIKHPKVIENESEVNRFLNIIDSEKDRMKSHIDRVLEIASLESNEIKLKLENVDLKEIIRKSIQNIQLNLSEVDGKIHFTNKSESAVFYGDEFHLTNVITNILDNSIKYRNGNPVIHISLNEGSTHFNLNIQDNGIGMNSNEQKHAFDKFYRAETGDIHNIKGFGLGLSYVKNIIEKHNGFIQLESKPNQGTMLKIRLPKKQ